MVDLNAGKRTKPHADTNTEEVNYFNFFETGYIMIDGRRYDVEEISINASRDMTPYHVAAQRDPIDQRPGKNKIEFSMKRAFSDATLSNLYDQCCVFDLVLINNDDPDHPQQILMLTGCRLTQDNIGPINGSDVVSQDLQGVARKRLWKMCDIRTALEKHCSHQCPPSASWSDETWNDLSYNIQSDVATAVNWDGLQLHQTL